MSNLSFFETRSNFQSKPTESRRKPAYLFLPSGSSESPASVSAEGASCVDRTDGNFFAPLDFRQIQ